jgi:hypothetical protein
VNDSRGQAAYGVGEDGLLGEQAGLVVGMGVGRLVGMKLFHLIAAAPTNTAF